MKKILALTLVFGFGCAFAAPQQEAQAEQAAMQKCEQGGKTAQQCKQEAAQKAQQTTKSAS